MEATRDRRPRKSFSSSNLSGESANSNRKPPSIYEINDLYSALQDLAGLSPSTDRRKQRASLGSSEGTSGADSPDIQNQYSKRSSRVARSSSTNARVPSPLANRKMSQEKKQAMLSMTPEMKYKRLSNQRAPIGVTDFGGKGSLSPKINLKKSKSDATRLRSKTTHDAEKSMAHKIREERMRFMDGLKKHEEEDSKKVAIEGVTVSNIDDLLELAKWSPTQKRDRKMKKKKTTTTTTGPRQRVASLFNPERKFMKTYSDSNLRTTDVSCRLNRWYEKASTQALQSRHAGSADGYDEYTSGSETDDEEDGRVGRSKGKSMDDMMDSDLNADEILKKWMGQKKKTGVNKDEREARYSSETSYDNGESSSTSSTSISMRQNNNDNPQSKQLTSIIISQASIDDSDIILPNQPIFYIPNLPMEETRSNSPTIVKEHSDIPPKSQTSPLLIAPARQRSHSAMSNSDVESSLATMMKKEMKSRSLCRRGSMEAASERRGKVEMRDNLSRTSSEYQRGTHARPHSINISSDVNFNDTTMHHGKGQRRPSPLSYENDLKIEYALSTKSSQKQEKTKKMMKFMPGKLKSLLTGKKS
eukprot:gene17401-19144_t